MGSIATSRITAGHIAHWIEHGYVVVPDFLTPDEVAAVRADMDLYYPSADEYAAHPHRYRNLNGMHEFPFLGDALNHITAHPDLIDFVAEVLGTPDVFITQGLIWGKYGGAGDFEQDLHVDYGNNTLVVPRDDGGFRQVPMILYYGDVTEDTGPTHVVSQRHTANEPLVPLTLARAREDIYANEQAVTLTAGSLFLYSMQTFHRGSAFRCATRARFSQHIVWRAAGYEWMGSQAFPIKGNTAEMRRFIEQATPRQRSVIGFPRPGHPYWNAETLAGVAARYPAMDMAPYLDG